MKNYVTEFKEWLEKQKYKPSVVKSYVSLVQNMVKKFANSDWKGFSDNAIYLLAAFYEVSNRDYYLDCVTTCYAINYFEKISSHLSSKTLCKNSNIKAIISIVKEKKDYFVCEATLDELDDTIKYLAKHLFGYKTNVNLSKINPLDLLVHLKKFTDETKTNKLKDVAIHIAYKNKPTMNKVALSKYCAYLKDAKINNSYFHSVNSITKDIKTKNPNKTVNGHYKIIQQISGSNPLIIKSDNENQRLDVYFTITIKDLSEIFNLNFATVKELLKKAKFTTNKIAKYSEDEYDLGKKVATYISRNDVIIEYETELRTYYNADNINEYLKSHHHSCPNPRKDVNYARKGYKYWYNREQALKTLGIGKTSFYKYLYDENNKISFAYLAYTPGTTKYYIPEIKKISQDFTFRKIRKNKIL